MATDKDACTNYNSTCGDMQELSLCMCVCVSVCISTNNVTAQVTLSYFLLQ
jgi:hypothetical protein